MKIFLPCEEGTFNNIAGSQSCETCKYPYYNQKGSTSCEGVYINLDFTNAARVVAIIFLTAFIFSMLYGKKHRYLSLNNNTIYIYWCRYLSINDFNIYTSFTNIINYI